MDTETPAPYDVIHIVFKLYAFCGLIQQNIKPFFAHKINHGG